MLFTRKASLNIGYAVVFSLLLGMAGFANYYGKFYTDLTGGQNILNDSAVIIPKDKPKLFAGTNIEADSKRMLEDNYWLLGYSSFNAGGVDQNAALRQAAKIHADTVLVYSTYTNTVSGTTPITVPNTQTSYHSGSIYGSGGGYANYSGSTTTYGTQTTYMPYSVSRYDYFASYWIKCTPPRLGIIFEDLTDELRKKIDSNKGVYVFAVVKDSPGFNSDILSGDVIRRANGIEVIDRFHFQNWLKETSPSVIEVEIFRNGENINKTVQLRP